MKRTTLLILILGGVLNLVGCDLDASGIVAPCNTYGAEAKGTGVSIKGPRSVYVYQKGILLKTYECKGTARFESHMELFLLDESVIFLSGEDKLIIEEPLDNTRKSD